MPYQNISASLSVQDIADIKTAINTITNKMPFLISLSTDERKGLYKMGSKSIEFVNDCRSVAQNYGNILPSTFNHEEFGKDAELVKALNEIDLLLNTLCEKVNDTSMAVGSEAMRSSLEVYDYVKTAAKRQPGLKSVGEQLKTRFKDQGKRTKKDNNEPK